MSAKPPKRKRGRPPIGGKGAEGGNNPPIRFRVTSDQLAELEAEAAQIGVKSASLAAKLRAFPKH